MPLYSNIDQIPAFPGITYNASNKRLWSADNCLYPYQIASGVATIGIISLAPYYIRYDIQAGGLEAKSQFAANGFTQGTTYSCVTQQGIYKVGSSIYDSTLIESTTSTDQSTYINFSRSFTFSSSYQKGWHIAAIVVTSGSCQGLNNVVPQNSSIFGNTSSTYISPSAGAVGSVSITGATGGLPSTLSSSTLSTTGGSFYPWLQLRY